MVRKKTLEKYITDLEKTNKELFECNQKHKNEIKDIQFRCNRLLEKYNELIGEINIRYYHLLPREKYEEEARKRFLLKAGTNLDLNDPRTLNEKIQWLKFNRDTPMKAKLTDKTAVRDWVREKLGEEYLKKIYGPWDTFDEIDMESLPEPFILKPNHGSAMTMIVKDKNEMDMDAARQKVNKWLTTNYAYRGLEMQYEHIKPKVFAEEYYGDKGKDFFEYKIYCFNGKVGFLSTAIRENNIATSATLYYPDWEVAPFKTKKYPIEPVKKPAALPELIRTAEILSGNFKFVRVDIYIMKDNSIKFGEMTFTPTNGEELWDPLEYDKIIGDMLTI